MNEAGMLKPALMGGVLLGILSALPGISLVNYVCCAWVIAGGVLAAYQYVKDSASPVTMGSGVVLGLFTGAIGVVVTALFEIPLFFLLKKPGEDIVGQLRQSVEQQRNLPSESRAMLEQLLNREDIFVWIMVLVLIVTLVIYCLFAMLGGAIGVALFEKRRKTARPDDTPQYPGPPDLPPPPDGP